MLRGLAILAVVLTHACWVFFPDFVIGNFHGLGLPASVTPFPFYNVVVANVLAVALLMAVSGYAIVLAWSSRGVAPPLPLSLLQRYLRLVLPALVAGLLAWSLTMIFGKAHLEASARIYDFGGVTWLSWFWSDPPTFASLAREFLLGQVEQNSALLMQLWMMPDLFLGSVLCLVVLRVAPKARRSVSLLAVALPAFVFLPLTGAVVLGAAIAALRQAVRFGAPGPALRCLLAVVAFYVGLNPSGSYTGGMALEAWYVFWLPSAWGPWATALAGPVLLYALLPERPSRVASAGASPPPGATAMASSCSTGPSCSRSPAGSSCVSNRLWALALPPCLRCSSLCQCSRWRYGGSPDTWSSPSSGRCVPRGRVWSFSGNLDPRSVFR